MGYFAGRWIESSDFSEYFRHEYTSVNNRVPNRNITAIVVNKKLQTQDLVTVCSK